MEDDVKKCKYCKEWIAKDAKICPHCRKKQGSGCVGVVLVALLFWFVVGGIWLSKDNKKEQPTQNNVPATTQAVVTTPSGYTVHTYGQFIYVVTEATCDSVGCAHIKGEVRNNGNDCNYVSISFSLYNNSESKVGNAIDNLSVLKSGETWEFEAVGFCQYDKYSFDEIVCN